MRSMIALATTALLVTGCATTQAVRTESMERLLSSAGFEARAADSPEQIAYLNTLPPRTVVARPQNGAPQYVYADPTGCRCVYVGGEAQYQSLRTLQRERAEESQQLRDVGSRRAFDGLWRGTWPPPLQ